MVVLTLNSNWRGGYLYQKPVELFAFDFQAELDVSSIWSGRTWTGNVPVKAEGKKKHPSDAERDGWISRFSTVTLPLLERNAYKRL